MNDPTFWRTEIWHPLSVHFPVAILLLATITQFVALVLRTDSQHFWQKASSYLLYLGCLAAWFSIYTGDLADGIVSRRICDPTVLKDHEIAAYNLSYLFSAATVADLGLHSRLIKIRKPFFRLLVFLLMLAGSVFLFQAGHAGARVVYQQAGGVQVPSSDCAGFQ